MKKIFTIVLIAFAGTVFAAPEIKRVCHTDTKTKKELCKNVKVHKKVEGTKVPEKAPANKKK
jgi:hypothetical protein